MTTTLLSPSPLASPVGSASPVAPVPTQPSAYPMEWTLADLQERLGGIPAERIHLYPWPGLATENDVLEIHARTGLLCELVDGILVEKPMGFYESAVAAVIIHFLRTYLKSRNLGIVGGEAGMLKILQGRIRIPDVSFIRWDRLPDDRVPVPPVSPDLAVEVLSPDDRLGKTMRRVAQFLRRHPAQFINPQLGLTHAALEQPGHAALAEQHPHDAGGVAVLGMVQQQFGRVAETAAVLHTL